MDGEVSMEEEIHPLVGGHPHAVPFVDEQALDKVEPAGEFADGFSIITIEIVGISDEELSVLALSGEESIVGSLEREG